MIDKPTLLIYEEQTFIVGQNTFVDSTAENDNAVVFEDNEETGYFYAVDRNKVLEILNALHIYNVDDVVDQHKPSKVKILWTEDLTKAFYQLIIIIMLFLILKIGLAIAGMVFHNQMVNGHRLTNDF